MKKSTQVSEKIPSSQPSVQRHCIPHAVLRERESLIPVQRSNRECHYQNADDLKIVTLENAIYMGMKNDLAFMLETNIYLYEHQSTINPNIPLRDLIYIGIEYQQYAE